MRTGGKSLEPILESLFRASLATDQSLEDKAQFILDLGCDHLDLPMGIVGEIDDEGYTVRHVKGPSWAPKAGDRFPVTQTYCAEVVKSCLPLAEHHIGKGALSGHPAYGLQGIETYIGTRVVCDGKPFGTMSFAAPWPREEAFSETDIAAIQLLAQWLGTELVRHSLRQEIQRQQSLFESVFLSVPDAMLIINGARQVQVVNPAVKRIFGYEHDEIVGQSTIIGYADPEEFERQGKIRYNASAEESRSPYEVTYRRKDGTTFPGETIGVPITDGLGKPCGFLAIIRDITQRRKMQTIKDEFIATVNHELRTPLTAIRGAVGILEKHLHDDAKASRMVGIARRNCDRLSVLIADLLDVDKISTGEMDFHFAQIDLSHLAVESVRAIEAHAALRGVTLKLAARKDVLRVWGDAGRLMQAVGNVLSNAIKFSPKGGVVKVELRREGPEVLLSIADQGPGIPESFRPNVFQRFSKADGSDQRETNGAGLGLNIAKSILTRHGGDIRFTSVEGEGTTFVLSLPLMPSEANAAPQPDPETS